MLFLLFGLRPIQPSVCCPVQEEQQPEPDTTQPLRASQSPKAIHSLKGVGRVADGVGGDPLLGLTIPSPFGDWL